MAVTNTASLHLVRAARAVALLLGFIGLGAGCSRVPITVTRLAPPAYNIPGGQRLAVLPFDSPPGRPQAGDAMSNALVSHLTPVGYYKLIERSQVKRIVDEQSFASSDFVDPATAARIGNIIGAELLIVGAVTGYSVEDQPSVEYVTQRIDTGYRDQNGYPIYRDETVPVNVLVRRAAVSADFRLISANDATVIASSSESDNFQTRGMGADEIARIQPAEALLRTLTSNTALFFFQKISPHQVTEDRVIFKGKTPQCKHGVELAQSGLWDLAIDQWNQAAQIRPDDFAPHHNLGVAMEVVGRYAEAEANYRRALGIAPQNKDVQLHIQAVRAIQADIERAPKPTR